MQDDGAVIPGLLVDRAKLQACSEDDLRILSAYCGACVGLDDMVAKVKEKYPGKGSKTAKHARQLEQAALKARPDIIDNLWRAHKL